MFSCLHNVSAHGQDHDQPVTAVQQVIWTLTNVLLPAELLLGFVAQSLNLLVLHRFQIRTLSYTVYLRTLCVIYLLVIPVIAISLARKANAFHSFNLNSYYAVVFFFAHLEMYIINVLLFGANLLTTVLAAESLRGLMQPFKSITDSGKNRALVITSSCLVLTAGVLAPVAFLSSVEEVADVSDLYCVHRHNASLPFPKVVRNLRLVMACTFEVGLILVLIGLYVALFAKYRSIVRESRLIMARAQDQSTKQNKAIGMCVGSIGAYVISNLMSAFKETLYLLGYFTHSESIQAFFDSDYGRLTVELCNAALFFNFSLSVCLQLFTSVQYRQCMSRTVQCVKEPNRARSQAYSQVNTPSNCALTDNTKHTKQTCPSRCFNWSRQPQPMVNKEPANSLTCNQHSLTQLVPTQTDKQAQIVTLEEHTL